MEKKTIIWHQYDINDMPDPEKDILVRYNEDCWDTTKINPEDWEDGFCEFFQEWAYISDIRATSKALDVAIDTLKEIGNNANCTNEAFGRKIADKALEKISEIIGGK